ncbi:CBS domain-containing protein [Nocardia rhamnosiphila]|uniref:CBS domain-containing protein n=1 Tax=Nocardia rhamnosiphila TaxID=426716 RepID=A0ABV2WPT0_9NOCA
MRARDILSRPVVTVHPDTPLPEAVALLTGHGFAALPVVDDEDHVVGILSESDAMSAETSTAAVETAMTVPVEVVGPTTDAAAVAASALEHRVRSLPVVEAGLQGSNKPIRRSTPTARWARGGLQAPRIR